MNLEGEKILTLRQRIKNAKKLITFLYKKPLITSKDVERALNITAKQANAIIQEFENLEILKEVTGYKRNRMFLFKDYYNLFADN